MHGASFWTESYKEEINDFLSFISRISCDSKYRCKYTKMISEHPGHLHPSNPLIERRLLLYRHTVFFSIESFFFMKRRENKGKRPRGIEGSVLTFILSVLKKYFLIINPYDSNKDLISKHIFSPTPDFNIFFNKGWIQNLAFGTQFMIQKYSPSVFKICVLDKKNEDESAGTGFLFKITSSNNKTIACLITNAHVVEGKELKEVFNCKRQNLNVKKVITSEGEKKIDIAALILENEEVNQLETFHFFPYYDIAGDILTMGFPRVPFSRNNSLLVHSGQLNGFTNRLDDNTERFVISARIGPGSSGGPVITYFGGLIGMIEEQSYCEDDYEKGILPYNMAIDSNSIIDFLNQKVTPKEK